MKAYKLAKTHPTIKLTWLFISEVVLKWYKLCTSPNRLGLVTSKTEYSISYIWFIKTTSCAIVTILLYTMYGNKLKTFVSSSSLLLLFKKGLRSKTKYKTTFIRISAVQSNLSPFSNMFDCVRSVFYLTDNLGSGWTWAQLIMRIEGLLLLLYQLSMNNNSSNLSRVISS